MHKIKPKGTANKLLGSILDKDPLCRDLIINNLLRKAVQDIEDMFIMHACIKLLHV